MAVYDGFLKRLDDRAFLGFRVWEFSFKSLSREYGHTFLKEVMLKHPHRTIQGCLAHRQFLQRGQIEGGVTYLLRGDEEAFLQEVVEGQEDLIVGLGFCLKPMGAPPSGLECPAGRPNHDCLYLARLDLRRQERVEPACQGCAIRVLGTQALRAGGHVNIMTSALDIAHDIMIPAVERRRFRRAILFLCPFSVQAILLPLLICGIQGLLVTYSSGNCLDYNQWLLADRGIKGERTKVEPGALNKILSLLKEIEARRGDMYVRFERRGNIYAPISAQQAPPHQVQGRVGHPGANQRSIAHPRLSA
ncbi:MAG: hypothetical protein ACE5MB_09495 [Anaerolineae bacterium]